ncbi:MAG: hypothetical protein K8W52_31900 [Deltaproteobacteria bacterium]|nr:hypothetical protein [Deltaproteobacteria bacterium]
MALLGGLALAACGDNAAGPDGGAPPDGGADAALFGCHPAGDYLEAHDATNDPVGGTAETTLATTAPGVRVTVGGCLDPAFATASGGDGDGFGFSLGGDGPSFLTARLTSPAGALIDGAQVVLIDPSGDAIAGARAAGGTAILTPRRSAPGAYRLVVRNPDGTAPADHVVTYQVELAAFTCDPPAAATATEAGDGDGTGNDLLAVTTTTLPVANPLGTGTAEDGGAAGPGDVVRLDGELAVLGASGDDYLDRDTWRLALTGDARRIVIAIDWAQTGDEDDDVDGLVLPADQPDALGGAGIGVDRPEAFGGLVAPGDAWLWVGARIGAAPRTTPLPYSITACVFD